MAEQAASDTSNNNNNNNNNRSRAVMLFGADISSPPKNNVQEPTSIDIESSNNVEASVRDGISVNSAVGHKAVSLLRARKGKAVHERKKGQPWTADEHLKFLAGLKKFGKGNWRNISKGFVPTKTPMQVATHAQKHFIRQALSSKKLRSSIFDMKLDEHAGTSSASTSRDTDEAPSPTVVQAEIRKVLPTAPPPYGLPANPPLAVYGLPNYLAISYPVGSHFDRKSTTPTNNTMLNHPWGPGVPSSKLGIQNKQI